MRRPRRRLALSLASGVLAAGCVHAPIPPLRPPAIDMKPLACGYKWFQSAYSSPLRRDCASDGSVPEPACLAEARADGWRIARQKCPDACAPILLEDSTTRPDQASKRVCRDGYAYCAIRLFFKCGP